MFKFKFKDILTLSHKDTSLEILYIVVLGITVPKSDNIHRSKFSMVRRKDNNNSDRVSELKKQNINF